MSSRIARLWTRVKDYVLGQKCARCDRRASGFGLQVRKRGKVLTAASDPIPLCRDHLKEFDEDPDDFAPGVGQY